MAVKHIWLIKIGYLSHICKPHVHAATGNQDKKISPMIYIGCLFKIADSLGFKSQRLSMENNDHEGNQQFLGACID
jgi:hypothetical protein